MYRIIAKKEGQSSTEDVKEVSENDAADKYVKEQTRELMFNMKQPTVPKGVWFSTFLMSAPLITATTYLGVMAPMAANAALVDPANFAFVARSCLRLLSLNISFFGGIHYGLASATYDVARTEEEKKAISFQMMYSFVPAIMAFSCSNFLLFSSPITEGTIIYSFTTLMLTQMVSLKFDHHTVRKEMAPVWFSGYRSKVFFVYMAITTALFGIYFSRTEQIQRKNDPNRIENLKNVLEMEDLDFIKMVDDLKLDFDEVDLKDVEKQISSKV